MEARYDVELGFRAPAPAPAPAVRPPATPDVNAAPRENEPMDIRRQDAECVTRVLAGETGDYRPLVERYERSVFLLARRLLRSDTAEAEDLTQDTFVRAYQYLGSLSDRSRFGPWLFQIARSLCRDRLRRKDVERRAIEHCIERLRVKSVPTRNGVEVSLSRLPPREIQVLHLRYFERRTYEEIAAIMGLTFSQVDHLIRRARASLATLLQRERQDERAL